VVPLKNQAMVNSLEPRTHPVSSGHGSNLEQNIRHEQVNLFCDQSPTAMFGYLAAAAVLVFTLWSMISHTILLLWASALLTVSFGRLWLVTMYRKQPPESVDSPARFMRFFIWISLAGGLVWGSAGVLLMPTESIGYQMLLLLIIFGMMAGSTHSLSAIMKAYVMFSIPAGLPVAISFLLQQTTIGSVIGLLIILFTLSLLLIARNLNKVMIESFRLRFENVELLADMETEIAARSKTEERIRGQNAVLAMLATNPSLPEVLNAINMIIEKEAPSAKSSILLLDDAGTHLFNASAPNLPDDYNTAINGGAIGSCAGSCGTAAYRNTMVIVEDIASDPLWADYKDLALTHGLRACWSIPIHNAEAAVLGTFALYYTATRKPDTTEIELIQSAADMAGIAIERCRTAEKLEQMALYDTLTMLPNRAMFIDRFNQRLAQARRGRQKLALLFIDLDRFKLINDTLGHEAGDRALQEVASRLQACVREVDTAARLGGDEFTLILTEIHSSRDAAFVAKKVIAALGRDIELEGRHMSIGGSIGISLFPDDGEDIDTLIAKSDTAMYQAKQKGGDTWIFYSEKRLD